MLSGSRGKSVNWPIAVGLSVLFHAVLILLLAFVPLVLPRERDFRPPDDAGEIQVDLANLGGCTIYVVPPSRAATATSPSRNDSGEESEPRPDPPETIQIIPAPVSEGAKDISDVGQTFLSADPVGQTFLSADPAGPLADKNVGPTRDKMGTAFFQIHTKAERIVYVLDRSLSMGKYGAFSLVRREVLASLHSLPEAAHFQIIVYNATAHPLIRRQPGWLPATPENKQTAAAELAKLDASGKTVHKDALPFALSLQPDVIFFLTDGDDLTAEFVQRVTRMNQGKTTIHVIEVRPFSAAHVNPHLQSLAQHNWGIHRQIDLSPGP